MEILLTALKKLAMVTVDVNILLPKYIFIVASITLVAALVASLLTTFGRKSF